MGNGVSGEGGAASSGSPPYASVEEAREAGRTQEEIDAYLAAKAATEAQPVDLTEAETVAVKLMFEQVDADANGMIDLKELTELFSTLGYLEDEVGPLSQQYMEKFDLVGNKELDFDAFIKLYGSLKASEGHRIEKYHNDVEEAEKEAARRLANRVARAKDPDFDGSWLGRCRCLVVECALWLDFAVSFVQQPELTLVPPIISFLFACVQRGKKRS